MADNDIYHAPFNEILELVRQAEAAHVESRRGTCGMVEGLPTFRDACHQVAFERGWDFGPVQGENLDVQFDLLMQAIIYVDAVRRARGLQPIGVMIAGLESGRDARVREQSMMEA